jgi:hypothetical protein
MQEPRRYDVCRLDVLRALSRLVDAERAKIDAEIAGHRDEWQADIARQQREFREAIERDRRGRERWETHGGITDQKEYPGQPPPVPDSSERRAIRGHRPT